MFVDESELFFGRALELWASSQGWDACPIGSTRELMTRLLAAAHRGLISKVGRPFDAGVEFARALSHPRYSTLIEVVQHVARMRRLS